MFHADISPLAAGLPPSILAAAAGRAARLAGFSVTDLLEVDAAHEKADIITATLEKVQQQYSRKKEASRDRRSAARKVAPAMPSEAVPSVASAAMGISQISIVGAEPEPLPPPPTPSPPPSPPPAKAPPRPSRTVTVKPPPAEAQEEEDEEDEEDEDEEDEAQDEEEESEEEESEEDYEPPPPPTRTLSRAPSRSAAPKKAAPVISATRARWGL